MSKNLIKYQTGVDMSGNPVFTTHFKENKKPYKKVRKDKDKIQSTKTKQDRKWKRKFLEQFS
jgi:hypothetical protein